MPECLGINEAYQHYDVNIGWYPYVATQWAHITTKPGAGQVLAVVKPGDGIGRQSNRNPSCKSNPGERASVRGADGYTYVWVYKRAGGRTGWIKLQSIKYSRDTSKPPLGGPAGVDFEVGRDKPTRGAQHSCGRRPITPYRNRRVKATNLHIRYSPRGTSKHYLHKGDRVKLLIVNGAHGFAFVEVTKVGKDSSARKGMRGWVHAPSLGKL